MVKRLEITKLSITSSKQNPHRVDARPIYAHKKAQVIILNLKILLTLLLIEIIKLEN